MELKKRCVAKLFGTYWLDFGGCGSAVLAAAFPEVGIGRQADFKLADGFASDDYGDHWPGEYSLSAGLVAEFVLTFMFLWTILGATDKRAPQGFAPIAIGFSQR